MLLLICGSVEATESTLSMSENNVYQLLKEKGFTDAQVAGIMGNIAVETGGTFDYQQKQKNGNGYGLFQFDFMKPYYFDYLSETEQKDSPEAQINFMYDTIYGDKQNIIGKKNADIVRKAIDSPYPEDVASAFMTEWEKPSVRHEGRRQGEAVKYYNFMGEGKNQPTAPVEEVIPVDKESSWMGQFGSSLKDLLK